MLPLTSVNKMVHKPEHHVHDLTKHGTHLHNHVRDFGSGHGGVHSSDHGSDHGSEHGGVHGTDHGGEHSGIHGSDNGSLHGNAHRNEPHHHMLDEVRHLTKPGQLSQNARLSERAHQPEHRNDSQSDHLTKSHDALIFTPLFTDKHHPVPSHIIDFNSPSLHLKSIDGERRTTGDSVAAHQSSQVQAEKPQFDARKSVEQNIREGNFKQASDKHAAADHKPVEAGKAPKITVVFENKNADAHAAKPNFIVKKDGSVTVVHNPEGPPHDANVVIQVARDAKQTSAPDKVQQKAVDDLVEYQGARIVDKFSHALKDVPTRTGNLKQVEIADPQNLVSDKVEQKFAEKLAPEVSKAAPPAMPVDVKHTSDLMNRVRGSHGHATIPRESAPGRHAGDASPAGVDQMIPSRSVPQNPKEANSVAAAKDAAAALFNPDRAHPYQTVRENTDHSYRVGRYGLNQGFTMLGLADLMGVDLGNPPDLSKLQAYMREHPQALEKAIESYAAKVNHDADRAHLAPNDPVRDSVKALDHYAKSLENPQVQNDLLKFLSDMNGGGQPLTQDQLNKVLPREMQELVSEAGIKHEAKLLGANPDRLSDDDAGKISLAFVLGRTPTAADFDNSRYTDYRQAGANMFKLAESRMHSLGDITVSDAQGKIMAAADRNVGHAMWQKYLNGGRLGCAASVSAVLNEAGFSYANSISVSALQDQLVAHGWTVSTTPHAGDVVCGYRRPKGSGAGGYAHTGIVGTDGTWDNHSSSKVWSHDPLSAWNTHAYRAGVVFLRPPAA